jgi:hypothetical protein
MADVAAVGGAGAGEGVDTVIFHPDGILMEYEGQIKTGKKHGYGTPYYVGHVKYEGQYEDGKRYGKGIMYYAIDKSMENYMRNFTERREYVQFHPHNDHRVMYQ